ADEEKVRDYLGKIKSSSNHLLTLINDMLEMSRIESGKVEINELPEDLEQIFSNIESILRGQAEAKNLIFVVDVSGVKHRYVYVDRLRLNQVIINLVSNAIKYTPDGGKVEVIIKETDYKDSKATYDIKVRDNGLGMSEEFAAKIFESFERENREEIRSIQGTGIGMAITKNIVDMFEGEITLDTKINVGSTFDVTVAFREASEEDIYDMTHKTDISEVDFDGMRVLLADDMEINREIAVAILELYGFDVVTAVDGKDALTKVVTHPPGYFKLVFMDIQMPKLNGYEASMAIRNISDRRKASVPIIAMTANAFESDIKDAKDAGMNGHVAKPIDQEKLVEEIKKVLSQD
nr:response regulator [Lachnospiraceae bacterium]